MRVSYRELLSVEMKRANRLNMISELRTERVYLHTASVQTPAE